MSRSAILESLPEELLVQVLHFCDYRMILMFSRTCRSHTRLIKCTASLQLKIELEANGLQLSQSTLRDSQDSLDLLRDLGRYCENWLNLSFNIGHSVIRAANGEQFSLWELRDGVFANGYFATGFRPLEANALHTIPLDSPVLRWNLEFDFVFHELAIDPIQDLVVLGCLDMKMDNIIFLRFCSLRTGLAHPLAKQAILPIRLDFSIASYHDYSTIFIQIIDELLVLNLISNSPNPSPNSNSQSVDMSYEVLILDWHSSNLSNRTGVRPGFCGATCLDKYCLLLFACEELQDGTCAASLLIYDTNYTSRTHPVVHESILEVRAYPKLSPILQLNFPEFVSGSRMLAKGSLLRSAPSPSTDCRASTFSADASRRTLSMTMLVENNFVHTYYMIFADTERLSAHLARARESSVSQLTWEAWGEDSTRWFMSSVEFSPWISWVYGSRFVTSTRLHLQNRIKSLLTVVDFCTPRVRRAKTRNSQNEVALPTRKSQLNIQTIYAGEHPVSKAYEVAKAYSEDALVVGTVEEDMPTVIYDLSPTPIISRLPYRHVTPVRSTEGLDFDWMIDSDNIIGIGPDLVNFTTHIIVKSLRI